MSSCARASRVGSTSPGFGDRALISASEGSDGGLMSTVPRNHVWPHWAQRNLGRESGMTSTRSTSSPRVVPVRTDWVRTLQTVAAELSRESWLFRPGRSSTASGQPLTKQRSQAGNHTTQGDATLQQSLPQFSKADASFASQGFAGYVFTWWRSRAQLPLTWRQLAKSTGLMRGFGIRLLRFHNKRRIIF